VVAEATFRLRRTTAVSNLSASIRQRTGKPLMRAQRARNTIQIMKIRVMKMLREMMMILVCLLFWAVALPLIGLMEVGVLVVDTVEAHTPHGIPAKPAQ